MASIQFQSSVTMPQAPASIAASSSVFAQMTRLFLAKRSASQPLHAEKSTNGSANRNVTCDWNTALPVVTARSRPACLKKLSMSFFISGRIEIYSFCPSTYWTRSHVIGREGESYAGRFIWSMYQSVCK